MSKKSFEALIEAAASARENSYCPYSEFAVGAALLSSDGNIYTGCNIESGGMESNCAERTAIYKAVSEGVRNFEAIAIVGGPVKSDGDYGFCYPCGICRQVMSEFCSGDFQIISAKSNGEYEVHTLSQLLPFAFGLEG